MAWKEAKEKKEAAEKAEEERKKKAADNAAYEKSVKLGLRVLKIVNQYRE